MGEVVCVWDMCTWELSILSIPFFSVNLKLLSKITFIKNKNKKTSTVKKKIETRTTQLKMSKGLEQTLHQREYMDNK